MKATRITRWLAVAGLLAGLFGPALAQDEERRPQPPGAGQPRGGGGFGLMVALDLNRDGKLQAEEIDMAVVSLRKLDRNGDGEVTSEELRVSRPEGDAAGAGRPGAQGGRRPGLEQLDKDGDGKISKEEAPERMQERFAEIDTNGDGFIDKAEQEALVALMRERFQQGGQRPGQQRPGARPDRGEGEGGADKPKRPAPAEEK